MNPDRSNKNDKAADEYTGNYGRGGYYGYTYDQEAYNKQVKKAAKRRTLGAEDESAGKDDTATGERPVVADRIDFFSTKQLQLWQNIRKEPGKK